MGSTQDTENICNLNDLSDLIFQFCLLYALTQLFLCTVSSGIDAIKHGWFEYIQQPVLPASLAYVLLYFNVALAPSGLMTAFLTHHGNV